MKKYMIDYTEGSGSGCDELFDTYQDAEYHMSFWTEKEREGCVIVEVEVKE
jgi:hypothetical protein